MEIPEQISRSMQQIRSKIEQGFQILHKKPQLAKPQQQILEKDFRKLLKSISEDYKSLNSLFKSLETPSQIKPLYPLTGKELERRRNQLNELSNLIKDLEQKSLNHVNNKEMKEEINKADYREKSEESEENRKKTDKQLFEKQREDVKNQEIHIESLLNSVITIKNIGMNINNELDEERGLLGDLEGRVVKNTKKLIDNNKKLDVLMEKVSNRCLICTIILEIIVIILLFALF